MKSSKAFIAMNWRIPKLMIALLVIEIPLTIAFLTLSGIADGDTYRTKLWQNGADYGFNSDPIEILYHYANYEPISVPLIWSTFFTEFNIVISVLSMFILLVKSAAFTMHAFVPLIGVFVHGALVTLYAISIHNQSAPDMSDPAHPSPGLPWYLSKGCGYATRNNKGYCMQARASFAVTIVMTALFFVYFVYSIYSSFPTQKEKDQRLADGLSDIELRKLEQEEDEDLAREEQWMRERGLLSPGLNSPMPQTPRTPGFKMNPMTPRTTAFTKLNGGPGPLKSSAPTSSGSATARSPGSLPFRDQYGSEAPSNER